MNRHNVVITCLPSGVYGTTSSATVMANMLSTFTSLQFGLMVGIGGGVPSEHVDIRLGDVVVSIPTANSASSGVVQYDYGKKLANGGFQRTGCLNKPPTSLLTAVAQLRSNVLLGIASVQRLTRDALHRHPRFSRPSGDWLFNSTYTHPSSRPDCSTCDPMQLVGRAPRQSEDPEIHYGLIASGNQVMKDAEARDAIANELGVLCFEMEAAGLMDQLPCLVIRGICDYCDSHKHKDWQGYASLTAAAYAKTLLEEVPTKGGSRLPYSEGTRRTHKSEEYKETLKDSLMFDRIENRYNSIKWAIQQLANG